MNWSIHDFVTKLRFLFGQNILELMPDGDPARRWFEDRISLPDYDTVVIAQSYPDFCATERRQDFRYCADAMRWTKAASVFPHSPLSITGNEGD